MDGGSPLVPPGARLVLEQVQLCGEIANGPEESCRCFCNTPADDPSLSIIGETPDLHLFVSTVAQDIRYADAAFSGLRR